MSIDLRTLDQPGLWTFLRAKNAPVPATNYRAVLREVASGVVWAGELDGTIIALGAVSHIKADGPGIAWLSVADGGVGLSGLVVVRAIRRVLTTMEAHHAQAIIAIVDDDNTNGRRLARLVGFNPTKAVRLGMRIWAYGRADGVHREEAVQPRQGSAGAPDCASS